MKTVIFNYNKRQIVYRDAAGETVVPFTRLKRLTPLRAREFYERLGYTLVENRARKLWRYEKPSDTGKQVTTCHVK